MLKNTLAIGSFIVLICGTQNYAHGCKPRVSIITSVFKGEKFIRGFIEDIVKQTIFDQCELIIINAASPEN